MGVVRQVGNKLSKSIKPEMSSSESQNGTASSKMEHYSGETTPILGSAATGDISNNMQYLEEAQFVSIDEPEIMDEETTTLLFTQQQHPVDDDADSLIKDEPKESCCPFRDWMFGLLFWLHLIAIITTGLILSPIGYQKLNDNLSQVDFEAEMAKNNDDMTPQDMEEFEAFVRKATDYVEMFPTRILFCIIVPCIVLGFIYSLIFVFAIRSCTNFLVKSSLYATVIFTAIGMAAIYISAPNAFTLLIAVLAVAFSVCFVQLLWRMIPFASTNIEIALHGVCHNSGIYMVAILFSLLGCAWMCFWFYIFFGFLSYESDQCGDSSGETTDGMNEEGPDCSHDAWLVLAFLISMYWTNSVILNTVQVTVAGTMATWCYAKRDAQGCCSSAIWDSLVRSMTYSFGSTCLGSFFQGFIAVIRCCIRDVRDRNSNDACDGCGLCLCLTECVARVLEDILNVFNRWAYVFVGVYGYPYVESGRKVMELFKSKGWMAIATDNLAGYVLGFTTLIVGVLAGASAVGVERFVHSMHPESEYDSFVFGPLPTYKVTAFL